MRSSLPSPTVTGSLIPPTSTFAATVPLHVLFWLPEELFPPDFTRVTPIQLPILVSLPSSSGRRLQPAVPGPQRTQLSEDVSGPLRGSGDLTLHLVPRAQHKTGHRFLLKQGGTCSGRRKPVFMLPKAAARWRFPGQTSDLVAWQEHLSSART